MLFTRGLFLETHTSVNVPVMFERHRDTWYTHVSYSLLLRQVFVYLGRDTPLFFTTDEAGEGLRIYPSLYLLHQAPQLLPVVTVHQGLGKKLLVTDLFMPGIVLSHVCCAFTDPDILTPCGC